MEIEDLQTLAVGILRKTDSELPLKINGWISKMTPYLKPEIHFLKPSFLGIFLVSILDFQGWSSHYKSVTWHTQLKRASVEDAVSPPGCRR